MGEPPGPSSASGSRQGGSSGGAVDGRIPAICTAGYRIGTAGASSGTSTCTADGTAGVPTTRASAGLGAAGEAGGGCRWACHRWDCRGGRRIDWIKGAGLGEAGEE